MGWGPTRPIYICMVLDCTFIGYHMITTVIITPESEWFIYSI